MTDFDEVKRVPGPVDPPTLHMWGVGGAGPGVPMEEYEAAMERNRDDATALVAAPVPIVECPVCLGAGEALSEDSTDDRKYECWHCYGDGEVKSGNPAVLAKWTQHLPDCARATTTAETCSCGLDDAWRALNVEPV